MEFILDGNTLHIDSEKKRISLSNTSITLDGMSVDLPGEYEKGGFLSYVMRHENLLISQFRIDGYSCVHLPAAKTELTGEVEGFLGDVDILILPGSKESIKMIELIEPRLTIAYGESAHEVGTLLGVLDVPERKHKLKDTDLSVDKTNCIILA